MIYYTPDMFDVKKLEIILEPLFLEKESLEFHIGIYQLKFDALRKINYKDLMIYERKKSFDKSLLPNLTVLNQLKSIEADESVKEFRQILISLNRELSAVSTIIKNEESKISKMFTFKYINMKQYLNSLISYFDGNFSFKQLMITIFNNEYLNASMYTDVSTLRNYEILYMLVQKTPVDWKDFARILFAEAKYIYMLEDLHNSSPETVETFIESESEKRNERKVASFKKQQAIKNKENNTTKTRSALNDSLVDIPTKIASDFVRSRLDADAALISKIERATIARGDWITKEGLYIKSTDVKWTNKV